MQEYIAFMERYCDFYDELVDIWQHKQEIVRLNLLHELESHSKKEEAGMLQARGLEKRRQELQAKLGFPDAKLEELIDQTDGETKQQLRQIKTRLNRSVAMLKSLNETCVRLTEIRLEDIGYKIAELGKASGESGQKQASSVMNRTI